MIHYVAVAVGTLWLATALGVAATNNWPLTLWGVISLAVGILVTKGLDRGA